MNKNYIIGLCILLLLVGLVSAGVSVKPFYSESSDFKYDIITKPELLTAAFKTDDVSVIKPEIFKDLKVNDGLAKTATFSIDGTKMYNDTKNTPSLSIVFNEVCGHVNSYDLVIPHTCTRKDTVCTDDIPPPIPPIFVDGKIVVVENKDLLDVKTVCNEVTTNYSCDEKITSLNGVKDYKIVNVDITPGWCLINNTYYKYLIDWTPKVSFGDNEIVNNAWAWWNATGGSIKTIIDPNDGFNYTVHTFTSNGTFTISSDGTSAIVQALIVGGGGAGGAGKNGGGAGGGAGGVIYNSSINLSVGTYNVTVAGATIALNITGNTNGSNSSFDGLVAIGGGGGSWGDSFVWGSNGGSGGGGLGFPGNGTLGQGNRGGNGSYCAPQYTAGGGGGAGTRGQNGSCSVAGLGGNGSNYSINGSNNYYAGGGGGGAYAANAAIGGIGGGGTGAVTYSYGVSATGYGSGGGGGGGYASNLGGNGSQGIVIIRYLTNPYSAPSFVGVSPYYFSSSSGNDSSSTCNITSPCQSLSMLQSLTLKAGDFVYFKRGDVWTNWFYDVVSGNSSGNVTYSSYGSGSFPSFWGAINASYASNWSSLGGNIWVSNFTNVKEMGSIWFNISGSWVAGINNQSLANLVTQNMFFYNSTDDKVYVYSTSNPATLYNGIEVGLDDTIFDINGESYVTFNGLDLRYGAGHGIEGQTINHIYAIGNNISFLGGAFLSGLTRYGNAIQFYGNANQCYALYNNISEIFDAALTNQNVGSVKNQSNILFAYNVVFNAPYCYETFDGSAGSINSNVSFRDNTCVNVGTPWGMSFGQGGTHTRTPLRLAFADHSVNFSCQDNLVYNVPYNTTSIVLNLGNYNLNNWNGDLNLNHNLYWNGSGSGRISYNGTYYSNISTLHLSVPGQEVNSLTVNPNLTDVVNGDFRPYKVSNGVNLACNGSSNGSYFGALPCNVYVFGIPVVNLFSPVNGTVTNNQYPTFTFNYTDSNSITANCSLVVDGVGNTYGCYQESANVSNQNGADGSCGLNYTGTYTDLGTWSGVSNIYDGDWNTYATTNLGHGGQQGYLYINYSRPINASENSEWIVSGGLPYVINLSFMNYSSCWNNSINNKLQLYIISSYGGLVWDTIFMCIPANANSTDDYIHMLNLTSLSGINQLESNIYVYEEAMNWKIKNTTTQVVNNNSNFNFSSNSLVDGSHTAYVSCVDNGSYVGNSSLVHFVVATNPYVLVTNPVDGGFVSTNNLSITYLLLSNSSENVVSYFNISLFNVDGSFNSSIRDNNGFNLSYFWSSVLYGFSPGSYVLRVDAVNSSGVVFATGNSSYTIVTDSILNIYAVDSSGSPISDFSVNLSYAYGSQLLSAFDNVTVFPIFSNTDYVVHYLSSVYNQTTYYSSNSDPNQNLILTIVNPVLGLCSVGETPSLWFNLYDEDSFDVLCGSFDYNFNITVGDTDYIVNGSNVPADAINLGLCVNASSGQNWTVNTGEVSYRATFNYHDGVCGESVDYVPRRYYVFGGTRLSNVTTFFNLYDLLSSRSTSFDVTAETNSLILYSNDYLALVRWYPGINMYSVVDMGLLDDNGQTVVHSVVEDVDYRMAVYQKDGTLLYLANPIRMVCLSSPGCQYNLIGGGTSSVDLSKFSIYQSLVYNDSTSIWTYTFSDPSQETNTMNLSVVSVRGDYSVVACESNVTGYVGAVTCNTSGYTGGLVGTVYRNGVGGGVAVAQLAVSVASSVFSSGFGLFLTLLLVIPIVFIFVLVSPVAAMVGGIIALIPALYFGSVTWGIVAALCIGGFIVLHFIRRT